VDARRRSWFDADGLALEGGRRVPFYAGAMHYWRVDPARWAACLRAMHSLGLTLVETYVPWRVHEPTRGQDVWTAERDLARFLETARATGMHAVLRPGPHVNAELTSFGMPDWVLADPECQARTAQGTPAWLPVPPRAFPIPSYASKTFQANVRRWYETVATIVRPQLWPDGPVVAIGVDNEAQMFFRTGPYDLDYHADALGWWSELTSEDPPRRWDAAHAARCARWVRFKDAYIARALGELTQLLDDVGLGELARFHNLPPGHHGLYDLRELQARIGGPVGIDAYTQRAQFPDLRRRTAALVGEARPIPIAFEVGIGFFPWFPPLDRDDDATRERDHLLTLLAGGVRGFNLYMAVERERYYGAAITAEGAVEAHAGWIRPLLATLAEVAWPELCRVAPIAVMNTRADERYGIASNVLAPMSAVLADALGLGPGGATELGTDKAAIASRRWQLAVCRALELAQVPYAIIDEGARADQLAEYRAVIVPTIDRVDHAAWDELRAVAEQKRTVVVIGPSTPTRDELEQPLDDAMPRRIGRLKAGSLDDLPGLAEDLAALAGELPEAWQVERPDDVRSAVFAKDGAARVVFVMSDAERPTSAVLLAGEGVAALRDGITGERVRVANGRVTIAMHPRGVRMFVIE
jgi:beta-galactosidase